MGWDSTWGCWFWSPGWVTFSFASPNSYLAWPSLPPKTGCIQGGMGGVAMHCVGREEEFSQTSEITDASARKSMSKEEPLEKLWLISPEERKVGHWIFEGLTWKWWSSPESFQRGDPWVWWGGDYSSVLGQTFSQGFLKVGWAASGCRNSPLLKVAIVHSSIHTDFCGGSTVCHLYSREANMLTTLPEIAFYWGKQAINKYRDQ